MTNETTDRNPVMPEGQEPMSQETSTGQSAAEQTAAGETGNAAEQTPVERVASSVYEQAGQAADAFRRGELMQDSLVDTLADSDDRLIAMLSYVTQLFVPVIMPAIVLLSESSKKRPFQRYHAVQSLAFVVAFWAVFLLAGVGVAIMQIIPVLNVLIGLMALCLTPIYWFAGVLLTLYYGYQAYKGKRFAIPGLTSFLRDQNWI